MINAAKSLFDSIRSYKDLELLVDEGEAESSFLECKSHQTPKVTRDIKYHLAKALSGFSNTIGGTFIIGVSTTHKEHSGLDVITQIEPIGHSKSFETAISNRIPQLTMPSLIGVESKVILKKKRNSRGVVILYIPPTNGDPVQSLLDQAFYYRSGDEFKKVPYQMLKRLFAATETPDLGINIPDKIERSDPEECWEIPFVAVNRSSAVAEYAVIQIEIVNPESCKVIAAVKLIDTSDINPGRGVYTARLHSVVHRDLPIHLGSIKIRMSGRKKTVRLRVNSYSNKMRARSQQFSLVMNKGVVVVKQTKEDFLY